MGQKVNSKIFRLGYRNNDWDSVYSITHQKELSQIVFQDLEIKNFIHRFFKQSYIIVYDYKIKRTIKSLDLYISYFPTSKSKLDNRKLIKSLMYYLQNKISIKIIFNNVLYLIKKNYKILNFYNIRLRKYKNKIEFFNEFIFIFMILSKKKKSRLLSTIISIQLIGLKRHNFFFNFLKYSLNLLLSTTFNNIKGIKIIIKGRLNGKPRSNNQIIQIGQVPLQTLDNKVDYFESTAFTLLGSFGIKVWIC